MSAGNPFDTLADAFTTKIYGSLKGQLRLEGLRRDLCEAVGCDRLEAAPAALTVLDVGAGDARLSAELAEAGCALTVVEPSRALRERARARLSGVSRVAWVEAPWETVAGTLGQFDVVLVHAVLEWLADPVAVLPSLAEAVAPGGWLSVAFYNRHGIVMRNLAKGNLRKVERGDFSGMAGGLTPRHAFEPEQLRSMLEGLGLETRIWSGLRTFYDFIPRHVRAKLNADDIRRLEARFSRQDPYRQLASYQHLLLHRPAG
ncbi:methyltransferase [Hahella sp. SMD15-11]|uniref:Methyltransferase n=1 Tax=Thermohahella caldifontis TaxID=3142973 RepID=A0AB39UXK1_9GAMM